MDHAITVGEILKIFGGIAGVTIVVAIIIAGIAAFGRGMSR